VSDAQFDRTPIPCNLCGEDCREHEMPYNNLGTSVTATGNYGSFFPQDMERWRFTLCEACFGAIVSFFSTPPNVTDVSFSTGAETPCESASAKALRGGDASRLQSWEHDRLCAALRRRASMQGMDADPLARLRAVLKQLPVSGSLLSEGSLTAMRSAVTGEDVFRTDEEDGTTYACLPSERFLDTVNGDESSYVAGLRGSLRVTLAENHVLRRVLEATLETVDDETRSAIHRALRSAP
jgi:hypothetical protein